MLQDEELKESYVLVSREDAVEAMALIVASTISKCPEAQKLSCKELHKAVIKACKVIHVCFTPKKMGIYITMGSAHV